MKAKIAAQRANAIDKVIYSVMCVESILISFSIKDEWYVPVMIGAMILLGLKITKRVWNG
mgnify:CR=1 FL=1